MISFVVTFFFIRKNRGIWYLFGIYISIVVSITLFPISFYGDMLGPDIMLNPLNSWRAITSEGSYIFVKQFMGNILMFVPLPIFLILLYGRRVNELKTILVLAMFISIGIEYSQLVESSLFPGVGRSIETNDVLLNTLGGVTGYYIKRLYDGMFYD